MHRKLSTVAAVLSLAVAVPAVGSTAVAAPSRSSHRSHAAVAAKHCGGGYKHAVIGGSQKCLRAGEFCSRSHKREYPKYGYRCDKRDRNGRWHLRRA